MKKLTVLRVLTVLAFMLLPLATVTPAYADGPVQERISADFSMTIEPGDLCSFAIDFHQSGIIVDQKWFDENGNLLQEVQNYGGYMGTFSANGKTVRIQGSGRAVFTPISETENLVTIDGHHYSLTIPGQGLSWGSVGQLVYKQVLVGDEWWDDFIYKAVGVDVGWDDSVICDYLGS